MDRGKNKKGSSGPSWAFWSSFFVSVLLFTGAWAQDRAPSPHYFSTYYTSKEYGQGSSGVSSSHSNTGVFHNPAIIGLRKAYSFDGGYIENGNGMVFSMVDGQSEIAAAGLGYIQMKGANNRTLRKIPLSAAKAIFQNLSLGTTISWARGDGKTTWQTDIGVWALLADPFSIGLVGKNLFGTPEPFDGRAVQLGFRYQMPFPVSLQASVGRDFQRTKTMSWASGLEILLPYNLSAQGGIRQTGYEGLFPYWSSGLGYVDETVGIYVSYEQAVEDARKSSFFVALTFQQ